MAAYTTLLSRPYVIWHLYVTFSVYAISIFAVWNFSCSDRRTEEDLAIRPEQLNCGLVVEFLEVISLRRIVRLCWIILVIYVQQHRV